VNRRAFLTAISCLPFLGFLKPEPEPQVAVFSNAHESSASNANTASGPVYFGGSKETDDAQNDRIMNEYCVLAYKDWK